MNKLLLCLLTIIILLLFTYGIKTWFRYKANQGKEQNNITIRKAIQSLLFGFLALIGLTPWTTSLIIQLINQIPGVNLQENSSNEFIGGIAYLVFCLSLVAIVYFYYAHRHRLHHSNHKEDSIRQKNSSSISYKKNVIEDSDIEAGGDLTIGD